MKEVTATTVGFSVAPIFPGLMFAVSTPVTAEGPTLLSVLGLLPIGYFFSALVTVALGVPAFLILRRLKLVRWWSTAATGFFIGIFVGAALHWPSLKDMPSDTWIGGPAHNVLTMGLTGAFSAFVFWLLWSRGQAPINSGVGSA